MYVFIISVSNVNAEISISTKDCGDWYFLIHPPQKVKWVIYKTSAIIFSLSSVVSSERGRWIPHKCSTESRLCNKVSARDLHEDLNHVKSKKCPEMQDHHQCSLGFYIVCITCTILYLNNKCVFALAAMDQCFSWIKLCECHDFSACGKQFCGATLKWGTGAVLPSFID